jgi:hypothetical protein
MKENLNTRHIETFRPCCVQWMGVHSAKLSSRIYLNIFRLYSYRIVFISMAANKNTIWPSIGEYDTDMNTI